ncbi:MAG: S8 family serine peptidase, partial [Bacteroidales bacterium]|nr:S8 family serine peptidase [Bacteroidales bacterium]
MNKILSVVVLSILSIGLFAQKVDFEHNTAIIKVKQDKKTTFENSEFFNDLRAKYGDFKIQQEFPDAIKPEKAYNENGQQTADITGIYRIVFEKDVYVPMVVSFLQKDRDLEYAEPLYKQRLLGMPNDPYLQPENANSDRAYQYWANTIHAFEAWDICQGDTTITIGISDTGSDLRHPDLAGNIQVNYDDPPDGIDNDNDGYIDNYKGWNFALNDNNAQVPSAGSSRMHGTYVSGISSAIVDNGIGVAGAGYKCRFVPLRIMNEENQIVNAYQSIVYAANRHFDVINCSWGSPYYQQMGQDVIDYATINHDMLVVAAAGNDGVEINFYPASYENVVSVAATNSDDSKWSGSSYSTCVDVSAPGTMFVSTSENGYATMWGGTSFASPIVAGAAGILRSYYRDYNALQIGEIIRISAENIDTLSRFIADSIMIIDSIYIPYDSIHVDSIWDDQLYEIDS